MRSPAIEHLVQEHRQIHRCLDAVEAFTAQVERDGHPSETIDRHEVWPLLDYVIDVLMPVYLVAACVWCIVSPSTASWAILFVTLWINLAMAIVHSRCTRYLKLPWYYALMMSVSMGLYVFIGAYSAWKHHFGGGHTWKGRKYTKQLVAEAHR